MPTTLSANKTAKTPQSAASSSVQGNLAITDASIRNGPGKISSLASESFSGPRGGNSNVNTAASSTHSAEGSWRSNPQAEPSSTAPAAQQNFPGFHRKNIQQQQQQQPRGQNQFQNFPPQASGGFAQSSNSNNYPLRFDHNNVFFSPNNPPPFARFSQQQYPTQIESYDEPPPRSYGPRIPNWDLQDTYYSENPVHFQPQGHSASKHTGVNTVNEFEGGFPLPWNQQQQQQKENYRIQQDPRPRQGGNNRFPLRFADQSHSQGFAPYSGNSYLPEQQQHRALQHEFNVPPFNYHSAGPNPAQRPPYTERIHFRQPLEQVYGFEEADSRSRFRTLGHQQPFDYRDNSQKQALATNRVEERLPIRIILPPRTVVAVDTSKPIITTTYAGQQSQASNRRDDEAYPPLKQQNQDVQQLRSGWSHKQEQAPDKLRLQEQSHESFAPSGQRTPVAAACPFTAHQPPSATTNPSAVRAPFADISTSVSGEAARHAPAVNLGAPVVTANGRILKGALVGKSSGFFSNFQASPPASRPATSISPAVIAKLPANAAASLYRAPRGQADVNAGGVLRQFRSALNKLAPDNFDRLTQECLSSLRLKATESILKDVIDLIYEKALSEHKYSSLYAGLCFRLEKALPNFDPPSHEITTFKRLLLEKVQKTYMNRARYFSQQQSTVRNGTGGGEDSNEAAIKMKQKQLNNMKFIGELGKTDLLTPGILLMCIEHLLSDSGESAAGSVDKTYSVVPRDGRSHSRGDDLECLCQILKIVGKLLYNDADIHVHRRMDAFMDSLRQASRDKSVEPRVRFFCLDIIELHENKWIPKRLHHNQRLKTLREVRQEAEREAAAATEASNAALRAMPGLLLKRNNSYVGGSAGFNSNSSNNNNQSAGGNNNNGQSGMRSTGGGGDGMYNNNNTQRSAVGDRNNNSNNNNNNNRPNGMFPSPMPKMPYNNVVASGGGVNQSSQQPQQRTYGNADQQQQRQSPGLNSYTQQQQQQQQSYGQQNNKSTMQQRMHADGGDAQQNEKPTASASSGGDSVTTKKYLNLLQRKKSGPALGASSSVDDELTFAPKSSLYLSTSSAKPTAAAGASDSGGAGDASGIAAAAAAASGGSGGKKSKQPASADNKDGAARAQIMSMAKEYISSSESTPVWKRLAQVAVSKRFLFSVYTNSALTTIVTDIMLLGLGSDSEHGWARTIDLLANWLAENKSLKKTQFFDAMDQCITQQTLQDSERSLALLLVYPTKLGACTVDDVLERLPQGRHYPLALDWLDALQRELGEQWLITQLHKSSRVNQNSDLAQAVFPPDELARGNTHVVELLQKRSLAHLCWQRVIESEIDVLLDSHNNDAAKLRTLISEKSSELRAHENFTFILLNKLFERFHNLSVGSEPDKPAQQCKSTIAQQLRHYKPLLAHLLKSTDNQLLALYALQCFYYAKAFPRGWMLLWFTCLYEADLVDEPTFWRWREQVNLKYPGKGQALFGLNAWFEYLKNAELEEEDEQSVAVQSTTNGDSVLSGKTPSESPTLSATEVSESNETLELHAASAMADEKIKSADVSYAVDADTGSNSAALVDEELNKFLSDPLHADDQFMDTTKVMSDADESLKQATLHAPIEFDAKLAAKVTDVVVGDGDSMLP